MKVIPSIIPNPIIPNVYMHMLQTNIAARNGGQQLFMVQARPNIQPQNIFNPFVNPFPIVPSYRGLMPGERPPEYQPIQPIQSIPKKYNQTLLFGSSVKEIKFFSN